MKSHKSPPHKSTPFRSGASAMISAFVLGCFAALIPAGLSAQNTTTIGFNTDGNVEGFTGYSSSTAVFTTPVVASGGFLTGTSPGGDPRLVKTSATAFFSKPAAATWTTVRFRVRETNETPAVVTPWASTGINLVLNSTTSPTTGAITIASSACTAVDDGDGFFIVTADISTFTANEVRYFRFDPIGGTDAAGNFFEVDWVEITRTNTNPALAATSPVDDSTDITPDATLTATFDEPIVLGDTGSVTIKNLTTSTDTVISLPGPDGDGVLSVVGNVLTIDPTAALGAPGDEIAIEISADAIKDAEGGFYAGILSTSVPNWSFTLDNVPPAPNYFHPIPATAKAPLDGTLFIVFNESIVKGSGNLVIYKAADDSVVETIDVITGNVSVSGSRVTITPTGPLAYGTSYYVLIDSGAFTDSLGNAYAGISDSAVWAFSTMASDSTILFGDSFNRPNDTDLNASAAGKYGSLGVLNYTSRVIGVGNVQLSAGQLLAQGNESAGQSGGLVYINHNFTDAGISTGGGFSITVDLNAYSTTGSGRYLSVGVGQSQAELDSQTTSNTTSSKGDLVVGYRFGTGNLEFFKNGVRDAAATTSGQPAPPTKMRIDYSLPDFNSGSTVNYSVFFDDSVTAIASGTFTWSGTNENYISLSSNLFLDATAGTRNALFDNLQIRTLLGVSGTPYENWATNDEPFDGDANGDGVQDGLAFLLGAQTPSTNALGLLPTVTQSGGGLVMSFSMRDSTARGTATLSVEHSSDLGITDPWTTVPVPDANGGPTNGVTFVVGAASGSPSVHSVTATIDSGNAAGGKLFGRLKATNP